MKNYHKIKLLILIIISPFPAFAGNYTYNLSQNHTTNGGGTWNSILSMTATITQNQTISATLSKQDKTAFAGGYVYLQKDLYEASSALNLSSDYITAGQYSVTVISYSSLENIEANWIDDEMKIYMRFESISGGYAWVGPIGIERQLIIGDINVTIEPDEVKPSAMWRAELKPNTWSLWFESGKTVSGFKPGETIIQFKAISGWETPLDQTIRVNGGDLVQTTGMYKKTLPMPPSDIVATKGKYAKKVHLTWNYVDNAYAYEIWRSTTNSIHSAQKIQLVNTNYFDDTTVLSEIYYYWVKSVNATGTSDFSAYDQGWPELLINLSPTHADFGPEDGNQYVQLTIPDNCQWSINNSLSWLSVESNIFGTGNEQIEYSLAPITQDGYRTGSLNVFVQCENFMNQNLTHTITQYSCSYSISPSSIIVDSSGGYTKMNIQASDACEWLIYDSPSWITTFSQMSGIGNETLSFWVKSNTGCVSRSGIIKVSGDNNRSHIMHVFQHPDITINKPTNLTLVPEHDTGIDNDAITQKTKDLVISGSGTSGAQVMLTIDDHHTYTGSVVNDEFYIPVDLTEGIHTIIARQIIDSYFSEDAYPLTVTVDISPPDSSGLLDLSPEDDTGYLHTDNITNRFANLTIKGSGETNATVQLYDNDIPIPNATTVIESDVYSMDITLSKNCSHSIKATLTDIAGNVSNFTTPIVITIDNRQPHIQITDPYDGQSIKPVYVRGIAADHESHIEKVELMITDGIFYATHNQNRVDQPVWVLADGTTSYQFNTSILSWAEASRCTIISKSTDAAGNQAITQSTFIYEHERQSSDITCEINSNVVYTEAPLKITGKIVPVPNRVGVFVGIRLFSPDGSEKNRTTFANANGFFSYDIQCGDIDIQGQWVVQSKWDGIDNTIDPATSDKTIFPVKTSKTAIEINAAPPSISVNETFTVNGQFKTQFNCNLDRSYIPVYIVLTAPNGSTYTHSNIELNTSGEFVKEISQLNLSGKWIVQAFFNGNNTYSSGYSSKVSIDVRDVAGYAIVIQGMIEDDSTGLAAHQKTMRLVYEKLKQSGFEDSDIQYFGYNISEAPYEIEIDDTPSLATFSNAITKWAMEKMNTNPAPLYIVMVDHGDQDLFYLPQESMTSSLLNQWITELHSKLNDLANKQPIVLVLGFCQSGSFMDDLSGNNRIIISSTSPGEFSHRGPQENGSRQGEFFVSELFKYAAMPMSIKKSFQEAAYQTRVFTSSLTGVTDNSQHLYLQNPMISWNSQQNDLFLGVHSSQSSSTRLCITQKTDPLFLDVHDPPTIDCWAIVNNNQWLDQIWIEIKSPEHYAQHPHDPGQMILDLPKFDGTYNGKKWEWKQVQGFDTPGTYQVFYFAKDENGNVLPFEETRVYRAKADNPSPLPFSLIYPSIGETFSTRPLLDWEDTNDENSKVSYRLLLSKSDPDFMTPVSIENLTESYYVFSSKDELDDYSQYYWKVQAIDAFGAIEETETWMFFTNNVNNNEFNCHIICQVLIEGSDNYITDVSIIVSDNKRQYQGELLEDTFYFSVPTNTHTVKIHKHGYVKFEQNYTVGYTNSFVEIEAILKPLQTKIIGQIKNLEDIGGTLVIDAYSNSEQFTLVNGKTMDWPDKTVVMPYELFLPPDNYVLFVSIDRFDQGTSGVSECTEPFGKFFFQITDTSESCDLTICTKGDIDNNHIINLDDVKKAFDFHLGGNKSKIQNCRANFSGDSSISMEDVQEVFKLHLGSPSCNFPKAN